MTDLTSIDTSAATLPARYSAAKVALRQCAEVDECKEWADKASALASYAKQAGDTQLEIMAKRIRLRAMRRAGELLRQIEPAHGANQNIGAAADTKVLTRTAAASEAGMSKRQHVTAMRIAGIPDDEFEAVVDGPAPPTLSQLAKAGGRATNRDAARVLMDALLRASDALSKVDLETGPQSLDSVQRARAGNIVQRLDGILDAIVTRL